MISTHGLAIWDRHDPQHPRLVDTITGFVSQLGNGNTPNLTISPDGRLIAAGDIFIGPFSGAAQVWDTRTRKPVYSFPGSIGVLSNDGRTLPFGYGSDTVLVNAKTGQREATVPNTGGAALAILSPDRHRIAVSEQEGNASVVVVYDLTTMRPIGTSLRLHNTTAYPVGFLPDGRLVTSSYTEAGIWTLAKDLPPLATEVNTEQRPGPGPGPFPAFPLFLPGDTQTILTEFGFGVLAGPPQLHDATTGQLTGTLFNGAVQGAVAPSPDGRLIAAGTQGSGVAIWDLHTHARIGRLTGVPQGYPLSWSPAGNLVAADTGTAVQLWNVSQPSRPALVASIPTHPPGRMDYLLFSRDGRRLVTASQTSGTISMIDIATRRPVWPPTTTDSTLHQVALSPDGKSLAIDSGDSSRGQLTVLDAATGKPRRSIPLPSYGGIAYLHNGQWIVATDDPASPHAQLYDAETLQPIGAPFPAGDPYGDPVAANNAGTIFSATDVNPLLWNVDPAAWVRTACDIASRNLTRTEWHEYLPNRPYRSTCPKLPPGA